MTEAGEITVLLDAARDGDRGALDRVLATLYQELHTMARRQLAGQQATRWMPPRWSTRPTSS